MKKVKMVAVFFIFVLMFSGCVVNFGARVYDDEKLIAKDYNTYNLIECKQSVEGNILSGSAKRLEGMGVIWKWNASEDMDVSITYQLKVLSGKAKLVLIHPDDMLDTLVEYTADSDNGQEVTDTFKAKKGKNRIKLVGAKGTKVEFKICIDKGEMISFD